MTTVGTGWYRWAMRNPIDIAGAPEHELLRSPAAEVVGHLATRSGLFMSHFEQRVELALPEHWLPEGRPDLGEPPRWQGGALPESKYQAFRHDRLCGSFHPGHRAKWTAHELCHGLVGFAWRPDATPFFQALAARLAEALPVALWYFFDEAWLRRCPDHTGGGPLYRVHCEACERAAAAGAMAAGADRDADDQAERWLAGGRAFLDVELEAVERSAAQGRLVHHRLGTLDLASDGLAYAAAHSRRLSSDQMRTWVALFCREGGGYHPSLESLSHRVRELAAAITRGSDAPPLRGGRWVWMAQDLGWRLLQVHADTDGDASRALLGLVEDLAGRPNEAGIRAAGEAYHALTEAWELPPAEQVLAVGYDLPLPGGRSVQQVSEGLCGALPATTECLGEQLEDVVDAFLVDAALERAPLGNRFARYLERQGSDLAGLASWEAALTHAPPADPVGQTLGPLSGRPDSGANLRLSPAARVLRYQGSTASSVAATLGMDGPDDNDALDLLVVRQADGDVCVIGLDAATATALVHLEHEPRPASAVGLDEAALDHLLQTGAVLPQRWTVRA